VLAEVVAGAPELCLLRAPLLGFVFVEVARDGACKSHLGRDTSFACRSQGGRDEEPCFPREIFRTPRARPR
jgi:hypothetical protein